MVMNHDFPVAAAVKGTTIEVDAKRISVVGTSTKKKRRERARAELVGADPAKLSLRP